MRASTPHWLLPGPIRRLREHLRETRRLVEATLEQVEDARAEQNAGLARIEERLQSLRELADLLGAQEMEALRFIHSRGHEQRARLRELRGDPAYERPFVEADPLISVVIPTYDNHRQLRERAIPSVLAQTYENFEIVVVGDAAPEAARLAVESFDDSRIRFSNLPYRGPYPEDPAARWRAAGTAAYNEAVNLARGLWIAPLDDDDAFRPDHLERLVGYARERRLELAYSRQRVHAGADRHARPIPGVPDRRVVGRFPPEHGEFGVQSAIYHQALKGIFEYELADAVLGLPNDWGLCARMMEAGVRIGMLDEETVDYYPSTAHTSRGAEPPLPRPYEVRAADPPPGVRRPTVLHVIANFYIGGSAQLVVDLVEHLGDRFTQRVMVRNLPPQLAYTNLDLHHYPQLNEEIAAACLNGLKPDLLHVHFLGHRDNPYSAADWYWYDTILRAAGARWPIVENLNIPVEPYASPAVSRYVYVSDYVRDTFGVANGSGVVIYPGTDLDRFSRRNPIAQDSEPQMIGMAYRLQEDKLNEESIEPFIAAAARRPQMKALIVGGGEFFHHYTARVESAGMAERFEFTGYVPYEDLAGEISKMGVFVAPVHSESFGQVHVFAMGLGLPVVGYDVGGLPEILGSRELLAPPGDVAALSQLIDDLLSDAARQREIGHANRERAVARFSIEGMVEQYEGLYRELLA